MNLSESDISRIIEMAWEDRTTFDAIEAQFGINEQETIKLMRSNLKSSSFKLWRKRVLVETLNIKLKDHLLLDDMSQAIK